MIAKLVFSNSFKLYLLIMFLVDLFSFESALSIATDLRAISSGIMLFPFLSC